MSFIIKNSDAFVNAKLTDTGRQLLASGTLNFKYYAFGDSEVDYSSLGVDYDISYNSILRPRDNQPDIKYPLLPVSSASSSLVALDTISPFIQTVYNQATERGFFTGSTDAFTAFTSSDYLLESEGILWMSNITGSTRAVIYQSPYYAGMTEPEQGDLMLVKYRHPNLNSGLTQGEVASDIPTAYLWYKIAAKTGFMSANTLVVTTDRPLPDFGAEGINASLVSFYPGGDAITTFYGSATTAPYWNTETLSFEGTCDLTAYDVAVLNQSNIFSRPLAGVDPVLYEDYRYFATSGYVGTKQYLGYGTEFPKNSVALIHYTNNNISNVYGEGFYIDADDSAILKLHFPTLMYHRRNFGSATPGSLIGMSFSSDTTEKFLTGTYNTGFSLRYFDLTDGVVSTGDTSYGITGDEGVVGRVFPDLKLIALHNEELVAATSYKGSRNWTLPQLRVETLGTTGDGLLTSADELYVTYILSSSDGYNSGVHCLNYTVASHTDSVTRDARVFLPKNQLPYMQINDGSYDGKGFYANNFKVICQKVNKGTDPQPDAWVAIDYTTSDILSGTSIDPTLLQNTGFTITKALYTGATSYDLNTYLSLPAVTGATSSLQFGDEYFFYGNLETYIQASIYKSNFPLMAQANKFNSSQNPTFTDSGKNVYISEVGIYDSSKNLVAIGKLSQPIEKKSGKVLVIELGIDF